MKIDDDDQYLKTTHWNRKGKESKWLFYILIGLLCFILAWVMSGAMK